MSEEIVQEKVFIQTKKDPRLDAFVDVLLSALWSAGSSLGNFCLVENQALNQMQNAINAPHTVTVYGTTAYTPYTTTTCNTSQLGYVTTLPASTIINNIAHAVLKAQQSLETPQTTKNPPERV